MQKFTAKIVSLMKAEGLFQSQGGPIIMSQVNAILFMYIIFIFFCIVGFFNFLLSF